MSDNPQDTRKPTTGSQSSQSGSSSHGSSGSSSSGDYSFRCKDAGHNDCSWETRGRSEDEVLRNVEPHARERHNIQNFDDSTRNKVRGAIKRPAA